MGVSGSRPQLDLSDLELPDLEPILETRCGFECEHDPDHIGLHIFGHVTVILKTYRLAIREEQRKYMSPNEFALLGDEEYDPSTHYTELFNMILEVSEETLSDSWVSFLESICRFENLVIGWRWISIGLILPHVYGSDIDWDELSPMTGATLAKVLDSAIDRPEDADADAEATDDQCPICYDPYNTTDKPRVSARVCNHVFCEPCVGEWIQISDQCPLCRRELFPERLTPREEVLAQVSNQSDEDFWTILVALVPDPETRGRLQVLKEHLEPFLAEMAVGMWDFSWVLAGFGTTCPNDENDRRVALVAAKMQVMLDHVDSLVARFLGKEELAEWYEKRAMEYARVAPMGPVGTVRKLFTDVRRN